MSAKSTKIRLSASAIECLHSCSWLYYVKYILKLPEFEDPALARGNIAHAIFELLHDPKHRKTVEEVISTDELTKPLIRLIRRQCDKKGLRDEEEKDLVCALVKVGLVTDFFCGGATKIESEQKFVIEGAEYTFSGFIDRRGFREDGSIIIRDFKSSKKKFKDDKIDSNIQAIAYSLHTFKQTGVIPEVEFLFLRFTRSPIQKAPKATEEHLKGFETYLGFLARKLETFNEQNAREDYAKDNQERCWLCQMGRTWKCRFMNPFSYYVLIRDGKDYRKSLVEKEMLDLAKDSDKVERREYAGCPAWNTKRDNDEKNFFDL